MRRERGLRQVPVLGPPDTLVLLKLFQGARSLEDRIATNFTDLKQNTDTQLQCEQENTQQQTDQKKKKNCVQCPEFDSQHHKIKKSNTLVTHC